VSQDANTITIFNRENPNSVSLECLVFSCSQSDVGRKRDKGSMGEKLIAHGLIQGAAPITDLGFDCDDFGKHGFPGFRHPEAVVLGEDDPGLEQTLERLLHGVGIVPQSSRHGHKLRLACHPEISQEGLGSAVCVIESDHFRGAAGEYDVGLAGANRGGAGPPYQSILLREEIEELPFNSMLQGRFWSLL
jgi:hypothetical protein